MSIYRMPIFQLYFKGGIRESINYFSVKFY